MWRDFWVKKKSIIQDKLREDERKRKSMFWLVFSLCSMLWLVELLCFHVGNCNGFWGHVQNSSSFKYIASSNNTDLASVLNCRDCTSISLPWRWVTEVVWVHKMTYYHYKSFYFIVWWPACGSGSRLDRKLCSLSMFVQFPLDAVADSTYLVSPPNIPELYVGRHTSTAMRKDILWCHMQHLIHLLALCWCILQHLMHLPHLCCPKKLCTSTELHFTSGLDVSSNLL